MIDRFAEDQKGKLKKILDRAGKDEEILALILSGNRINNPGKQTPDSNPDICLILTEELREKNVPNSSSPPYPPLKRL